jgi:hypothetical protein
MASFDIGMTPCFLEIQRAAGSFAWEIPRQPDDAASCSVFADPLIRGDMNPFNKLPIENFKLFSLGY